MKPPILPLAMAVAALALHTSCKPKPAASPAPEAAAPVSTEQSAPAAPAAPPVAPPPQGNAGGNRPGGGQGNFQQRAEERMQRMKSALGLSDEQTQKIQAIYTQQFGSLRQGGDQSASREDRRAAFEKARAAAKSEIEQILTPEQMPKWEAYQKEMEQRRQQGGNRRNGGGN